MVDILYELTSGEISRDPRIDCVTQVDLRSLNYPVTMIDAVKENLYWADICDKTWDLDIVLDQGKEGACVSAGWGHELAAEPYSVKGVGMQACRKKIYFPAQKIDEWPGGSYPGASPRYEGTSVLAGAKIVKELGLIDSYHWARDIRQLAASVSAHGPAVIGVTWHQGMVDPASDGFIRPTGQVIGKHCVCLVGVEVHRTKRGDINHAESHFIVHNSWGSKWGDKGRAKLSFVDLGTLFPGGDFCVPVGRKDGRL